MKASLQESGLSHGWPKGADILFKIKKTDEINPLEAIGRIFNIDFLGHFLLMESRSVGLKGFICMSYRRTIVRKQNPAFQS